MEQARTESSSGLSMSRWIARYWVHKSRGKIRWLRPESLAGAERLLLVLNGAPNFLHAAAVAAALDRPVRILIGHDALHGWWERWLARQLGVLWQDEASVPAAAREALTRGETVAVFAQTEPSCSETLAPSCVAIAKLALGAASPAVTIVPLHVVDCYGELPAGELLIAAGAPIAAGNFQGGASGESSLRALAGALEDGLAENPFHLDERDVRFFLSDLESVLRADIEEDWAARPNWKQKSEGFEISRFLVECAEDLNARDPAALGGLRIELERYREELRRSALLQAEVEAAGDWLKSSGSRARYWLEAILEAPLAFYGFINHLIPIALLMPGNLLGLLARKDPGQAWLLRILVVLGTYVLLVSLCARA
jgi:hypothetical protein